MNKLACINAAIITPYLGTREKTNIILANATVSGLGHLPDDYAQYTEDTQTPLVGQGYPEDRAGSYRRKIPDHLLQ